MRHSFNQYKLTTWAEAKIQRTEPKQLLLDWIAAGIMSLREKLESVFKSLLVTSLITFFQGFTSKDIVAAAAAAAAGGNINKLLMGCYKYLY